MFALFLFIMATSWLIAAADDNPNRHTHGAIAFIRTGERTPLIEPGTSRLSAVGAQQMHRLGQMFRGRYIGDERFSGLGVQRISGLQPNILDPDQLFIQTLDRAYLQASAQAFMQGLYPPTSDNGGLGEVIGNGSRVGWPLGGYQYAPIRVAAESDYQSVYLAGGEKCGPAEMESRGFEGTERFREIEGDSEGVYGALDGSLFGGLFTREEITFSNAIEIYEYLSYAYTHDSEVQETLSNDATYSGIFDRLKSLADEYAYYTWGNTSTSSSDPDLRAISGKTLAYLLISQFQALYQSHNGPQSRAITAYPLTLLFANHEPFISLFSLLMLDHQDSEFRALPPFASAIVFELFSLGDGGNFPSDPADLYVSFGFQNGTDFEGELRAWPMFNGNGSEMSFAGFERMMSRIMINIPRWCGECSSAGDEPAIFCGGVDDDMVFRPSMRGQMKGKGGLDPVVAGVVGAMVTLAVAGLLFALLIFLGGIRLGRIGRRKRKDGLGGFKGSAKLASDADLNLPKNGAAPAGLSFGAADTKGKTGGRVESWELRQKEVGDEGRKESFEAIEEAMGRPVQPVERV